MSTPEIAALVKSVNEMTGTVAGKMREIDNRVDDAESEYHRLIDGIRSDFPFYRVTKNQELKTNAGLVVGTQGTPDGWTNRSPSKITCEIVAYSETGTPEKDPVVHKMWMDIKGYVPTHNQPDFAVIRLAASLDYNESDPYTIYQGPLPTSVPLTFGCWIKAENGIVRAFDGGSKPISTEKWEEVVLHRNMSSGGASYVFGPHFYLSPGASCLIALPAAVAGKVPVGKWGYVDKPTFEREGK